MAPHQALSKRAQVTVNGAAGIVLIVLLVLGILFITITVLLICKNKHAYKKRQRKVVEEQELRPFVAHDPQSLGAQESRPSDRQESRPWDAHEYRIPEDQRAEMGAESRGPVELQSRTVEDTTERQPQQLDGFAAPATAAYDGKPLEMPAQTVTR
jgi:hypothetical protein